MNYVQGVVTPIFDVLASPCIVPYSFICEIDVDDRSYMAGFSGMVVQKDHHRVEGPTPIS